MCLSVTRKMRSAVIVVSCLACTASAVAVSSKALPKHFHPLLKRVVVDYEEIGKEKPAVKALDMKLPKSFGATGTENLFYSNSFAGHGVVEDDATGTADNATKSEPVVPKKEVLGPPKDYKELVNRTRAERLAKLKELAKSVEEKEELKVVQRVETEKKEQARTRNEVEQRSVNALKQKIESVARENVGKKKNTTALANASSVVDAGKVAVAGSGSGFTLVP